jgi:hypothetical protein
MTIGAARRGLTLVALRLTGLLGSAARKEMTPQALEKA